MLKFMSTRGNGKTFFAVSRCLEFDLIYVAPNQKMVDMARKIATEISDKPLIAMTFDEAVCGRYGGIRSGRYRTTTNQPQEIFIDEIDMCLDQFFSSNKLAGYTCDLGEHEYLLEKRFNRGYKNNITYTESPYEEEVIINTINFKTEVREHLEGVDEDLQELFDKFKILESAFGQLNKVGNE